MLSGEGMSSVRHAVLAGWETSASASVRGSSLVMKGTQLV